MNYVLAYQSISSINNITLWLSGLLTVGLIMRALRDFLKAYADDDMGLKEALKKVRTRVFAVLIAITATSLITFLKKYF